MRAARSFLRNRIAMLLINLSMIMGFIVPTMIADYRSDLSLLDQNAVEIHILDLCGMRDCIIEASASERLGGPSLAKSGGRSTGAVFSAAAGALPDASLSVLYTRYVLCVMPALPGMRSISSLIIQTVHLKDGRK